MAYCTVADIQSRFKNLPIDTGTAIKTAQVQGLIDQYSASIDARIAKMYVVPVDTSSATSAAQVLKLVCIYLVVAELEPIVGQTVAKEGGNYVKSRDRVLYDQAEDMLADIETGKLELVDATRKTSNTFVSGNVSASVCAVFKKDRTQW